MTPNEARAEINSFTLALLRAGLAASINLPVSLSCADFSRITWPAASKTDLVLLSDLPFASLTEYRRHVLGNQFNAIMKDASIIQLSVDVNGHGVVGHRFCFYPCPVILPASFDVLDFDALDLILMDELDEHIRAIEASEIRESEQFRLRSPIRFDFAPHASSPDEPACHMHVLNGDTRIAVHGPLSLGDFIQFIFRNFYPSIWADRKFDGVTRWPIRVGDRTVTEDEELTLYLNVRRHI